MREKILCGRYRLDPLSRRRGGMGEVWFGHDIELRRPVAVKFVRTDRLFGGGSDKELMLRFVRECRITASLGHPGIPAVYDCGKEGKELFLVMQRVEGCPVDALIDETEIPVAWAAVIAAGVCSVLAAAHEKGLVHRDLKPGNLILEPDGGVKVLDFGLAAVLLSTTTKLTQTGMVMGTAAYFSPEQVKDEPVDARTDLYALGVILDEMLAGTNQFAGRTPQESAYNHAHRPPAPVRLRRPGVPAELERLVLALLAKSASARPSTAREVFDLLIPFCRDVPPLLGYVDDPAHGRAPSPARMYARVLSRVTA
ncbi:serine/threonine-protein kinase [Streptosporangium sp. NPDC002721]|uniref:serine/threonine-protein kinase n=1 Tax=Streptosporangium sp. NPDC002721 TaxID=3366188 RepID=UPI00369CEB9D